MTLKLVAVPFHWAMTLSDPNTTPAEKAYRVYHAASFDPDCVMSLWMLQGYYDPTGSAHGGVTPATQWWLDSSNPWSALVRDKLADVPDAEAAMKILYAATCVPDVDWGMSRRVNGREYEEFMPGNASTPSNLLATYVRQLAQMYFPQFPELAAPTCRLYREELGTKPIADSDTHENLCYRRPMDAFADNESALQYLAQALPGSAVGQFPSNWLEFRFNRNDEWRTYEHLGLSLEEGYALSCNKRFSPSPSPVELPSL